MVKKEKEDEKKEEPKVKRYPLIVPEDLWQKFKKEIPAKVNINKMIIRLITQFANREVPSYSQKEIQKKFTTLQHRLDDLERDMRIMKSGGMSPFEDESEFPESILDDVTESGETIHLTPVVDDATGKTHYLKTKPMRLEDDTSTEEN